MNKKTLSVEVEWDNTGSVIRKTWSPIANIDQFRWLSRADVLSRLETARDEIGVRHVRACAMYSPEMRVWTSPLAEWRTPPAQRTRQDNWQLVDISVRHLLDRGLKPVYTTCFTPMGMTSQTETCWPDKNPVGMPDNLDDWAAFVASGLRHHQKRFGKSEMRSWYFECWNEPNLSGFFAGSQEDFFRLWSATWRAVKSVDPEFRFGGPSTARGEWVEEFLDWTAKDGTPPDYVISHVYNNDSESQPLSPFDGPASHRVKDSPHFASGVIRGLRRSLDARGWTGEIHWNEWGRSWFPHDLLKESALEAAFVGKTMMEVSDEADSFAFWCLSDIYDQIGFQSSEFDGHYGLLSLSGLRKPAYNAHLLLNRLEGKECRAAASDPRVTALGAVSGDTFSVLIAAYPNEVGTPTESLALELNRPPGCNADPTVIKIGEKENNILWAWKAMGSPAYPDAEQLQHLFEQNHLSAETESTHKASNARIGIEMENPGLVLLTWKAY